MLNTVCLCGSFQFRESFDQANRELTRLGFSVISICPGLITNIQETDDEAALREIIDLVHLNKILRADAVFVVGDGYIGKSTAREILWAEMQARPVITEIGCCSKWVDAAHRLRQGISSEGIYLKAREVLGLLIDETPWWHGTRRCPTCSSADIAVASEVTADGARTTSCAKCSRHLRTDRLGYPPWEDAEWVKSVEN